VVASHAPAAWQVPEAVQTLGVPAAQTPAWQESPEVQALPSLQVAPLAATGLVQTPVAGAQTPATWH
jgi:hypothetical protein